MEYDDSEKATEVAERMRAFMDEVVLPTEREHLASGEPVSHSRIDELREEAQERDLWGPQIPEEYGGQGLEFREILPAFEQVGRSLIGATAVRANAPDEGNIHTLEMVGTEDQKEEWMQPLIDGEMTSGFSMTEPLQGGGSDQKMLQTTATKDGDEWVINGHKWWTSGGREADVLLVMARTDFDAHPYEGCSFVLVPTDTEGVEIVRNIPHLGGEGIVEGGGIGHAEIEYDDVRVPVENTLGEENRGFQVAQMRLGPARLTHCMRYTGMATRALDVAKAYLDEREAFDSSLSDKQALRHRIADAETKLHAGRTMVRNAAWRITEGDQARVEVAMAKTFTANATQEAIDLALQCCGGNGIGKDLPIAYFYESVRTFRIVDGADEVHRRVIARDAFEDPASEEVEHITRY